MLVGAEQNITNLCQPPDRIVEHDESLLRERANILQLEGHHRYFKPCRNLPVYVKCGPAEWVARVVESSHVAIQVAAQKRDPLQAHGGAVIATEPPAS